MSLRNPCRVSTLTINTFGPFNSAVTLRSLATSAPPLKKKRTNRIDIILLITGFGILGSVLAYRKYSSKSSSPSSTAGGKSFTIPILEGKSGNSTSKVLSMLSSEQVESRLKEHESIFTVSRPGNPVYRELFSNNL